MTRPTREQINIALEWLRMNEGGGGEAEACAAVAGWIETLEYEAMLRRAAREGGVPVAALRRRLASDRDDPTRDPR